MAFVRFNPRATVIALAFLDLHNGEVDHPPSRLARRDAVKRAFLAIVATAVLVVSLAAAAGDLKPGDKELDGRWIQGQVSVLKAAPGLWKVVYGHELDLKDPTILIKDRSVASFEGGKLTFANGAHEKAITIECDPTKAPKAIDFVIDKDTRFLGVYEIKDGKLTLGIGDGKTRPMGLMYDEKAPGQVFLVYSKLKPRD